MRVCAVALRLAALLALAGVGCARPAPGQSLGVYDVRAELTENSCGGTAVPMPTVSKYVLEFLYAGAEVMWRADGDSSAVGTLTDEGRIRIESEELIPYSSDEYVEEQTPIYGAEDLAVGDVVRKRGCTLREVELLDVTLEGELEEPADGGVRTEPRTFKGKRSINYVAGPESDCSRLAAGAGGLFLEFPCEVQFSMQGTERLETENE